MKILAEEHIPFVKEYFGNYGELILKPGRTITNADVKDADMLLVRSITRVTASLLQNSKLKFVGSVTAGADHLDIAYLQQAGIPYSVAQGFNAPPVADYIVSVIAALQKKELLLQHKPKALVVGVGNVGKLVVERLQALGFDVSVCDPLRSENEKDFVSTSLFEAIDMDLITLHVPLSYDGDHATYHLINKNFLERQKPGCVIINASRGAVINSEDLKQYGQHLHYCLDVWENEPKIDLNLLQSAIIATPHIAGYSAQAKIRGTDMIYRIACTQKMIEPQVITPKPMPEQQFSAEEFNQQWREIVLGVFDPVMMTGMLRATLLSGDEYGYFFDEMRNQFNYRQEFAYTKLAVTKNMAEKDRLILQQLGFVNTTS